MKEPLPESGYDGLEYPKPPVKAQCKTCSGKWPSRVVGGVISPSGIEHVGLSDGMTACGRDATGDNWWWPL